MATRARLSIEPEQLDHNGYRSARLKIVELKSAVRTVLEEAT